MRAIREAVAFLLRRADQRAEDGWTLIEMMVAIAVSSVVLGGATMLLGGVASVNGTSERQMAAQENARNAIDSLAAQLRNAIGPAGQTPIYSPATGSTSPATELVFYIPGGSPNTSTNPRGLQWIRYCLDSTDLSNETLWMQTGAYDNTQAGPPSTASCPSPAWTSQTAVATQVVNAAAAASQSGCKDAGTGSHAPFKPTTDAAGVIHDFRVCLLIQGDSARRATEIGSSLDFRNAKTGPTATLSCSVQNKHAVCDASRSSDPDGEAIGYQWKYRCCSPSFSSGDTTWESGQTSYLFDKGPLTTGTYAIYVQVTDTSGLSTSTSQNVAIP